MFKQISRDIAITYFIAGEEISSCCSSQISILGPVEYSNGISGGRYCHLAIKRNHFSNVDYLTALYTFLCVITGESKASSIFLYQRHVVFKIKENWMKSNILRPNEKNMKLSCLFRQKNPFSSKHEKK